MSFSAVPFEICTNRELYATTQLPIVSSLKYLLNCAGSARQAMANLMYCSSDRTSRCNLSRVADAVSAKSDLRPWANALRIRRHSTSTTFRRFCTPEYQRTYSGLQPFPKRGLKSKVPDTTRAHASKHCIERGEEERRTLRRGQLIAIGVGKILQRHIGKGSQLKHAMSLKRSKIFLTGLATTPPDFMPLSVVSVCGCN